MSPKRSAQSSRRRRGNEGAAVAAIPAVLALAFALAFSSACASTAPRPLRDLPLPDAALKARVLAAWDEALARADSMGPARILYDAKFGKGAVKLPGTLAVYAGRESLTVKASGPFGVEVGSYEGGRYAGKEGEASLLDPAVLRGVLAGVWRGSPPHVAGADSEEGWLRWEASGGVSAEGRLDLPQARLTSLRVRGNNGEVFAEFSGAFDPWPAVILLQDRKTGRSLKLKRAAVEAIQRESGDPRF